MRRSLSLGLLLGLAALASAQDSTPPPSESTEPTASDSASPIPTSSSTDVGTSSSTTTTSTSTSSGPITHTVAVAKGGHTFEPDVTQANVGDTILFQFYPTNHSVIRAEYGYPCIPYEDTGVDKIGFFSGFKPVDAILNNPPSWSLVINDTNPIFYYCGAPGSCINFQMVGVINPNATTSLVTQKQLAKDSTFMLLPGQPWPDEGDNPFVTTSSAPTASATAPTTSSTLGASAAGTSEGSSSHHSSLSSGAIAGIAIGASAVGLAAAVLLYLCGRQSRRQQPLTKLDDRPGTGHATIHQVPFNPHMSQMSYMDHPSKHMSFHSGVTAVGPALPGYVPQHDPAMSPPLPSAYPANDLLNQGVPGGGVAPAYSSGIPTSINSTPHHSIVYTNAPPPPNIHEMAASEPMPTGGIIDFIRRSSMSKSGGVERYG